MEQIRAYIQNRPHQQAASAPSFDHQAILRPVPLGEQVFGTGSEVGECVFLVHHAAVIVPRLPHLPTAANMGHRHDHPTTTPRSTMLNLLESKRMS